MFIIISPYNCNIRKRRTSLTKLISLVHTQKCNTKQGQTDIWLFNHVSVDVNGFTARTKQRKMRTEANDVGLNGAVTEQWTPAHADMIAWSDRIACQPHRSSATQQSAGALWATNDRSLPVLCWMPFMRLTTIVDRLCIAIIRHVDVTRLRSHCCFCCRNRIYFHLTVTLSARREAWVMSQICGLIWKRNKTVSAQCYKQTQLVASRKCSRVNSFCEYYYLLLFIITPKQHRNTIKAQIKRKKEKNLINQTQDVGEESYIDS